MKTSYFHGARNITIGDMPDTDPAPDEILLNVAAVGVCGSDLHNYVTGNIGGIVNLEPLVLGHEASGYVAALGSAVDPAKYRVGQLVAIDPAVPCEHCEFCLNGLPNLCNKLKFIGMYPDHGAMRERMVHPARCCIPVPDVISDVGAAVLEPLGVALHGIRLAKIEVGEDVFVIGCGGVGLLLIRLAQLSGARRVIAADRNPYRLQLAGQYGADHLINVTETDLLAEVARITDRRGVDLAIEAAWVKDTAAQCVEVVRLGGRVVIVGIPAEDELHVRASAARRKEVPIYSSRRMKHVYPATIALAVEGKVDLDTIATHRIPLNRTKEAFELAASYDDHVIRAMVMPNM